MEIKINKEIYFKFKGIYDKKIYEDKARQKRKNILFYVVYSSILGIFTFLILTNKISIHYIIDWVIVYAFIFSIGYPIFMNR